MTFDWRTANRRALPGEWLEFLRQQGERLANASYEEVLQAARDFGGGRYASDNARVASLMNELGFAKDWARSGFAQITVDDKLFASLSATRIPNELIDLTPPWNTFIVRVPDAFQHGRDWGNGILLPVVYMQLRPYADAKEYQLSLKTSDMPGASVSVRLSDALREDLDVMPQDWDDDGSKIATYDSEKEDQMESEEAYHLALRRAFVGVILELNNRTRASKGSSKKQVMSRSGRAPSAYTYKLTRPVVVDCRDWLKGLARGESRRMLSVQTLVRGHWKNQPHGPGAAERKFIHIEPYWRGPEDAPIGVRPHLLKDSRKKPGDGSSGAPPQAAE